MEAGVSEGERKMEGEKIWKLELVRERERI